MSSSSIVVRTRYQTCKNLRHSVSKTISYIGDKKKADASSIDEFNILKDYAIFSDIDSSLDEDKESFIWSIDGDIDAKEDLKEKKNIDEKGTLWSLVISFPPGFAIDNGLVTKLDYYKLTKNVIPDFLLGMGLKLDNVTWYCSLHRNTKNPHLHINFYEHKKTLSNPKIPYNVIYNLKSNIGNYLINNEKFYRLRDLEFKNIISDISFNDLTKIKNQKLYSNEYRKELNKMLLSFYSTLPKKGRLQYNSKNMNNYRDDLDKIIEFILMHDSVKYNYAKYLKLLSKHQKELNMLYGNSDKYKNKYYDNQLNKLYTKIGNEILSSYKIYQSYDSMMREKQFLMKHINELNFKSRSYKKDKTIQNTAVGLYKICTLAELNYSQMKKVFEKWIKNSHYNINAEELIALVSTHNTEMSTTEYYNILNKLGYNYDRFIKIKNKNFYQELNYKKFINRAINHLMYELEKEEKEIVENMEYELDMN